MTTKYQIGDKVHVEFTVKDLTGVVRLEREQVNGKGETLEDKAVHYIFDNDPAIVKHIPKPWEPKAGDHLRYKAYPHAKTVYTVRHIIDKYVWVEWSSITGDSGQIVSILGKFEPYE